MQLESLSLLYDVRKAAKLIGSFTLDRSFEDYLADPMLRSAVERQFEIIGEALSKLLKLDPGIVAQIDDYRRIISFRNVLIHGYAVVVDQLVWEIAETKLPALLTVTESLLQSHEES